MNRFKQGCLFVVFFLLSSTSHGADSLSAMIGIGTSSYTAHAPSGLSMDSGLRVILQSQKAFEFANLFLTTHLNYSSGSGNTEYQFTSGGVNYTASNVNFDMDNIGVGIGLKIMVIPDGPFQPYAEVGLTGGYFQFTYDGNLANQVSPNITGFKTVEGLLQFGYYGELGFDIPFQTTMGIRLAYQIAANGTNGMDSLNGNTVSYADSTFYGGWFFQF